MTKHIDLGWLKQVDLPQSEPLNEKERELMLMASALEGSYGDDRFLSYFMSYPKAEYLLHGHDHILHYTLRTKWYLSEIEDVIRHGMFLYSKIVFELPMHVVGDHAKSGSFFDGDGSYRYSFFSSEALQAIFETFGDAISGNEILLLPNMRTASDEGPLGESLHSSTYKDFFRSVDGTWRQLSRAEQLGINNIKVQPEFEEGLGLPFIAGGDIKSLISLRRDEQESFLRWRRYLSEVVTSSTFSEMELYEAISQGLSELSDHIRTTQRKGFLDAIGGTAILSGIGVAVRQGEMGYSSAAIGLVGAFAQAIKALIEQRYEYRKYSKDPLYFAWLAQRVH